MLSLIGLTQAMARRKVAFAMKTWEWSDLVISRNYLMSYFLAQKQFTHALLLDSDMSYPAQLFFDQINDLFRRIADLDAQIAAASKRSHFSARLQKMPGIGPITSMALAAFAPPMETFRQARDFSAWLGLVPRPGPGPRQQQRKPARGVRRMNDTPDLTAWIGRTETATDLITPRLLARCFCARPRP